MKRKKAQIWVETVVYTLIGISVIGILLAVAKPRIDEIRDRLLIEQTIESFNQIHGIMLEIQSAPGYQRTIDFKLSRGNAIIDCKEKEISWKIDSNYRYSQPGSEVELGKIRILTEESNPYTVSILLRYPEYNLTISDEERIFEMQESPTPYNLIFQNKGAGRINIEVR